MRKSWLVLGAGILLATLLLVGLATGLLLGPWGDGGAEEVATGPRGDDVGAPTPSDRPGPRLAGHPEAVRPEDRPEPPRGEVVVSVVDEDGVPIAAAWVSVYVGEEAPLVVASDPRGEIVLADLPSDQPAWVGIGRRRHRPDALVPLGGERVTLTAPRIVTLSVRLLDAESGVALGDAGWRLAGKGAAAARRLDSGDEVDIVFSPERRVGQPYLVEPGRGYVDWGMDWSTRISRYARRIEAHHPLRREARVTIVPVDAEGGDVRDAQVNAFAIASGVRTSPSTGNWLLGGIPLHGVPFFAGQRLNVSVGAPGPLFGAGTAVLPAQAAEPVDLKVVLKAVDSPEQMTIEEIDQDIPFEESLGTQPVPTDVPETLLGALEVRVLRSDGRPAVGARVDVPVSGIRRTDADGRLLLEQVLAGEHVVALDEPGLVPTAEPVRVVAGTRTIVTLREPEGATLVVTVKDEAGRALPFARLEWVSPSTWADLDPIDGVQRIDPFTDERGRRTLRRVPPGEVRLRARWGSKMGRVTVTAADRERKEITLVAR